MPLTKEEVKEIGKTIADEVIERLEHAREEIATRDLFISMFIGEGAIPVHG